MNKLGECFYHGDGCDKNLKKAVEFYEKAANLGNPVGNNFFSNLHLFSDILQAIRHLGFSFQYGQGYEKNEKKAVELYDKAANLGDVAGYQFVILIFLIG